MPQPALPVSADPADRPLSERIREDIVGGHLPAGARLVVADLARRYGSSSNPVREALQQLQGQGFVVFSPNRGARVRTLSEDFARDIYDIRALIEPYMIRWFVGHATDAEIAEMEAVQREIEALPGDLGRYRALNERFHGIVYDRHFNREAVEMEIRQREVLFMLNSRFSLSRTRWSAILREHREILGAIRAQDADAAALATERHVRGAGQHLIEQIRSERAQQDGGAR